MHNLLKLTLARAKEIIEKYDVSELPTVDVVMLSCRPTLINRIADNINNQVVKINKIIIVTDGYGTAEETLLRKRLTNFNSLEIFRGEEVAETLGGRNNFAVAQTTAEYIAIMDDDDIYMPNYLKSMLGYLKDTGIEASVVSKNNPVARDESTGNVGFIHVPYRSDKSYIGAGGSFVFHRKVFDLIGGFEECRIGYDSIFLHAAKRLGVNIIVADPFNFIVTRGRPEGNTWNARLRSGIKANNIDVNDLLL